MESPQSQHPFAEKLSQLMNALEGRFSDLSHQEQQVLERVKKRVEKNNTVSRKDQELFDKLCERYAQQERETPKNRKKLHPALLAVGATVVAGVLGLVKSLSSDEVQSTQQTPPETPVSQRLENRSEAQQTSSERGVETLEVAPVRFRVEGSSQERQQVLSALPQAVQLLQQQGLLEGELTPQHPIVLICDSRLNTRGMAQLNRLQIPYEEFLHPESLHLHEPVPLKEGHLQILLNVTTSSHQMSGIIAHEILHHIMGYIPQVMWSEGMAEAFEVMNGSRQRASAENYQINTGSFVSSEDYEAMILAHDLLRFPINSKDLPDSIIHTQHQHDQSLDFMRRYSAGLFWMDIFSESPHFLMEFTKKLKRLNGRLPQEEDLLTMASEIIPNFRERYQNFTPFSAPQPYDKLFTTLKKGTALEVVSAQWTTVQLFEANGKTVETLVLSPKPFWIRINGQEVHALNTMHSQFPQKTTISMTFSPTQRVEISEADPQSANGRWVRVQ